MYSLATFLNYPAESRTLGARRFPVYFHGMGSTPANLLTPAMRTLICIIIKSPNLLVIGQPANSCQKLTNPHLSINPVSCWFIGQPANSCQTLTNPHLSTNPLSCWFLGQPANSCQKLINPRLSINQVNCWFMGQPTNSCQ